DLAVSGLSARPRGMDWLRLLGPDPALVHVPGRRLNGLLLCQPPGTWPELLADVRPRDLSLARFDRLGRIPDLEREAAHRLHFYQRALSDRAGLQLLVPALESPGGRADCGGGVDPGGRLGLVLHSPLAGR